MPETPGVRASGTSCAGPGRAQSGGDCCCCCRLSGVKKVLGKRGEASNQPWGPPCSPKPPGLWKNALSFLSYSFGASLFALPSCKTKLLSSTFTYITRLSMIFKVDFLQEELL
ncbi:Hypothetical predicted protein [Podarcis lilfordi]|uniref:Uncharacterized protein n=1 Tax=Podarcis lilfordi TaxID=74358 RepID=A0AA35KKJ4_9SAUR|nr:Hypothetical predicted protein [Podarcis lilfordi]